MCSLVSDHDFDLFCVTETWLHPHTPSEYYSIPGYTMLRFDWPNDALKKRIRVGVSNVYHTVYEEHTLAKCNDPCIEKLCVV